MKYHRILSYFAENGTSGKYEVISDLGCGYWLVRIVGSLGRYCVLTSDQISLEGDRILFDTLEELTKFVGDV